MAHPSSSVKIINLCQVAPPLGSAPSTTLPLTFFDIPWLFCRPMERVFFYEYPYPTHHFIQTILPTLKLSLSLTLQQFFPFASNLICPPQPNKPHLLYVGGDAVSFTVAESTADFNHLVANYPKDVNELHPFVPRLPLARVLDDGTRVVPLIAIQVTVLPNSGIAICVKFLHVAADGRAFHHFMKSWASIFRSKGDLTCIENSLPFHNRAVVEDPIGLGPNFVKQWWNSGASEYKEDANLLLVHDFLKNKVRATLLLGRTQIEKLKHWVSKNESEAMVRTSTFVVTCAMMWVCWIKSEQSTNNEQLCHFVLVADCRDRYGFSIPQTYFGNCLALCFVPLKRRELVAENGIVEAVKAIGNKVRELESEGVLRGAERWMLDWKEVMEQGHHLVTVAGSPKLDVYQTDFGWGRPKKSEAVQIDMSESMSIAESRDEKGGIEIGLALERAQMDKFNSIYGNFLKVL
ncbi:putative Anthocyanin 5-aromatic acyltransferase [Quillaja saponaria]|uniref:Anthocyanin 5-aromatic acyltransferase n=1 Tax=Quillaja saponaria TaxID=32244 RepID=A0AAD7PAA7_QUISA|nr:putative Anthocyanin 5-aromatic acyltransferase [Quillaja saponaria]